MSGSVTSRQLKQKKRITLPSGIRIWQPEFPDLTLSHKTGTVHYDVDVQSPGFPTDSKRIIDYVEQRYLTRVRSQNVSNFGTVLAKSLLKGVPGQWEALNHQITTSLVAVRDRAGNAWPDVSLTVVRLIDRLEPQHRLRAIAFIAAFNEFWPQLQEPTRTALLETIERAAPGGITDYNILMGVTFQPLRGALLKLIAGFTQQQLIGAINFRPLPDLWDRAIEFYQESESWRGSEGNFASLITPFAGHLNQQQFAQLLGAIIANGQNWDAAGTNKLLLGMLRNSMPADLPNPDARARFYQHLYDHRYVAKYNDVITIFQSDGWQLPPPEEDD